MSSSNMNENTNDSNGKEQQKPALSEAEEIQALKAELARTKAAAAAAGVTLVPASEVKPTAESPTKSPTESAAEPAPQQASSSTPATGSPADTAKGYLKSWPRPEASLHPPEQQQRLGKPASRPPQSGKKASTTTQERVEQPSVKEKGEKVRKQHEAAKTERPTTLGGYLISSASEQGLAGSRHAPGAQTTGMIPLRQTPGARGNGRGNRGRGSQGRGSAVIKKEEGERPGVQIRGAAQRGRSTMSAPPRPQPQQASVPAPSAPGQQPCHVPFCSGTLTVFTPLCPLCGTPRQEAQGHGTHPAMLPPYQGPWSSSSPFQYASSPLAAYGSSPSPMPQQYGGYPQYPSHYGTPNPPFGYPAYFAAPPQSSPPPPFGFSGYNSAPPPTSPAPSVNLTVNAGPSQQSSASLESSSARGSATPAPLPTGPSRTVKRERSPSSSLHGESQPAGLSKRQAKRIRKSAARSASIVLPSIETSQPPPPAQPAQPPQPQLLHTSRKWTATSAPSSNSSTLAQLQRETETVLESCKKELTKAAAALALRKGQSAPSPSMPSSEIPPTSSSATEVAQQLPKSEPDKSGPDDGSKTAEQPSESEPDVGDEMEYTSAPSNAALTVPSPPQTGRLAAEAEQLRVCRHEAYKRLTSISQQVSNWHIAAHTECQAISNARIADLESQTQFLIQQRQLPSGSFDRLLDLHQQNREVMLREIDERHQSRAGRVHQALLYIGSALPADVERACSEVEQADQEEIAHFHGVRNMNNTMFTNALNELAESQLLSEALAQTLSASRSLPATSPVTLLAIPPASSPQSNQSTALIPREDSSVVPFNDSSRRIDELEDDGLDIRMRSGIDTSASQSTVVTTPSGTARRRKHSRPEVKRLEYLSRKDQ